MLKSMPMTNPPYKAVMAIKLKKPLIFSSSGSNSIIPTTHVKNKAAKNTKTGV